MRNLAILVSLLFFTSFGFSQLIVTEIDEDAAGEIIAGPGVEIITAGHYGGTNQLGSFSGGLGIIGIESGVVLTTGNVELAGTGNGGAAQSMPANGSDFSSQLSAAYPGVPLDDVSALQISFEATSTVLQFDFVFASEEYLEYVGEEFNDAIGVFIDGPGFSDEFAGYENVALVPGTSDLVNINNVNTVTNATWYVNNPPGGGPYGAVFAYDGFTKKMTIVLTGLSCGSTYNLHFAVADAIDENFDAALFIGANSVQSNFDVGEIVVVDASPFCEGDEFTASITHNPSWNYTWSTGESGFGVSSVVRTAVFGVDEISVVVADGDGCLAERSAEAIVHTDDNVAPWLTNTEFTYYVYPDETVCFGIYSADTPNEEVYLTYSGIPVLSEMTIYETFQQSGLFCWTPTAYNYGEHSFEIYLQDNNSCGAIGATYTFKIQVLCPICPICIYYEDRTPEFNPLPALTEAGKCIEAGFTAPVVVGDEAEVIFKAGESIELGDFFVEGLFYAEIIGASCVDECAACCEEWTGFTYDTPIPNILTPNGDGINDVWFLNDEANSWCAFNALGFEMWVVDRWGITQYHTSFEPNYCCPFHAANDETGLDFTIINWDGKNNAGIVLNEDQYWISIRLIGCTRDEYILVSVKSTGPHLAPIFDDNLGAQDGVDRVIPEIIENETAQNSFKVFPSPVSDVLTVVVAKAENPLTLEIYDLNSNLILSENVTEAMTTFDVKNLSAGLYIVILRNGNTFEHQNFIKQ